MTNMCGTFIIHFNNELFERTSFLSLFLNLTFIFLITRKWLQLAVAKTISAPFLLATFLVYAFLPERNIHRKALTFHALCLMIGNILLGVNQFIIIEDDTICKVTGFLLLYCLSTSYFWMTVMCIDIWLSFSGLRGVRGRLGRENVLFIVLSLFAWGTPAIILIIVVLFDTLGKKTDPFYPGIGLESCFLRHKPSLLFYFGPTIVLIVLNCILFVLITIKIQKTKKEAAMLARTESAKHSSRNDEMFTLYWNLLFVMGINPIINSHLVQLISWTVSRIMNENSAVFFIYWKDVAHSLYGIVLFFIFVCKKKIWTALKCRFLQLTGNIKNTDSSVSTTLSNKSSSEIDVGVPGVQLTNFKKKTEEPDKTKKPL